MGETDEAAPSKAGSAAPTAAASKRRKYTTRGKRGGKKHRSAKSKREDVSNAPDHARKIALYHVLEKKIARATDEKELVELRAQQEQLGGIKTYQQASLHGARHGESSKWLVAALEARHGRRPTRLLDVGAIAGTSYRKYRSIKPTYIDIDPQADHVIKADFLKYPVQEEPFDVVCLSLVLNFVGSIEDRVEILRRAHLFVREEGYLYVVLPLACVANSRYIDEDRFKGILQTLGWSTVQHHDSAMLTHWLLQKGTPDNEKWPRREIRTGVKHNNFVLIVK